MPAEPSATPPSRPAAESGADLARRALAEAKEAARQRASADAAGRRRAARPPVPERASGEPVAFGSALRDLVSERGWQGEVAVASVLARWGALVGADIAARCRPVKLDHGELVVEAESTAWATQLRLLSRTLLARLQAEVGRDVVTRLVVRGPVAPTWRHGAWSVQGGRGPRDTYG